MSKKRPFKLPKAFITQLKEFTNGFIILSVDENNNFNEYCYFPSELAHTGLVTYMEVYNEQLQEHMHAAALTNDDAIEDEDEDEEDD